MYAENKPKETVSRVIKQNANKKQDFSNRANKDSKSASSQVNSILNELNRFNNSKESGTIQKTAGTGKFLKSFEGYTRHHIIPESTLEAFYRNVKTVSRGINAKDLDNTIKELLYKQYQNIKFSKDLRKTKTDKFYDIQSQDILYNTWIRNLEYQGLENLLSDMNEILIWFPANLVIGPMNRRDDPGNGFDEKALKFSQNKNKSFFRSTFDKMSQFNRECENSPLDNYNELNQELIVLHNELKRVQGEKKTAEKRKIHNEGLKYQNPYSALMPVPNDFTSRINELLSEINERTASIKVLKQRYDKSIKQIKEIAQNLNMILEGGKEMTDAREEDWSA